MWGIKMTKTTTRELLWKKCVLEWHTRKRLSKRSEIKVFPDLLEKTLSLMSLSGEEAILDLGCGEGIFMGEILSRYKNVKITGVDFSDEMLQMAYERLADIDNARWTLHKSDVDEIDFNEEYDVVLVVSLVCHLSDPAKCIENIYNALKPNGRVVISHPAKYSLCRFKRPFMREKPPTRFYTKKEVVKMLGSRFTKIRTDEYKYFNSFLCPIEGHIVVATKQSVGHDE